MTITTTATKTTATTGIIMNSQHSLMEEQEKLLNERFGSDWEFVSVPASGWDKEEIKRQSERLVKRYDSLVILSPIPLLLKELAGRGKSFSVFHNDRREKKELPNGKIITVVAKEGWELL